MSKELTRLQHEINGLVGDSKGLRVLEAGCGSLTHLKFPADAYITGIDISQEQLDNNKHLHERILGDIQTYDFPGSSFDVIVCWNVLEHLDRPQEALKRFAGSIARRGIIVLSAPNLYSPKGVVTKFTPYAFHVWFYRNVRGWKEAGTGDHPPFPTYLRTSMSPEAVRRFARSNRLEIVFDRLFGSGDSIDVVGRKSRAVDAAVKPLNLLLQIASLGRLNPRAVQYYLVLQGVD